MLENLSEIFIKLCLKYSNNNDLIFEYWKEVAKSYSQKNRHYHNLSHLEKMIIELKKVKNNVEDIDSVLFSIFYHDIFYKSTSKDNKGKSAEIAKHRLEKINLDKEQIEKFTIKF